MDYYEIGQRIRKIRKVRGLSQEELSEKVGISTTHMSHIETGNTKMSLPIFVKLANVLEVQTDELLHEDSLAGRSASVARIAELLDGCTSQQVQIIEGIVIATKESLNQLL